MGLQEILIFAIAAIVFCVDCSSVTCADVTKFEKVQHNSAIRGVRFFTLHNQTFLGCAKQCLLRSVCQSYNFEFATGICELNEKDSTTLVPPGEILVTKQGFVTSDRTSIRPTIAGVCNTVSCPKNSACTILSNGTWRCKVECPDPIVTNGIITSEITHHVESILKIDCDRGFLFSGRAKCQPNGNWTSLSCEQGCVNPPLVIDGELLSVGTVWEVGAVLEYKCAESKVQLGKAICKSDFSWKQVKCISAVGSCLDLQRCNSTYTDGEYWLVSDSNTTPVKIYCHHMGTNCPKEFLTLPEENYVDFSDVSCVPKSSRGCESTRFFRLRITEFMNLKTIRRGIRDYTFINTTRPCYYIQYGSTVDCNALKSCKKPRTGDFVINTRGTGLKVDPNQQWMSQRSVTFLDPLIVDITDSGRHITVRCHQPCAWCYPANNIYTFVIDEGLPPDINSATAPVC